jgi:hypothetical protein
MKATITRSLLSVTLPLAFLVGCAHGPQREARFDDSVVTALTPTSQHEISRIYADAADPNVAQEAIILPTAVPEGAATDDWALGESVRAALTSDKSHATYPSRIIVVVDKETKGLVRLTGTVSSDRERRELEEKITNIPGVQQVDNQLRIGTVDDPGEVDIRVPVLQQ